MQQTIYEKQYLIQCFNHVEFIESWINFICHFQNYIWILFIIKSFSIIISSKYLLKTIKKMQLHSIKKALETINLFIKIVEFCKFSNFFIYA